MELTIYDEDRDKKSEFLGKVAIPLLRVRALNLRYFSNTFFAVGYLFIVKVTKIGSIIILFFFFAT